MCENSYTTNVGDYLVIWITGRTQLYIAEVTQSEPLCLKVEETGPFSNLKAGDFILRDEYSEQLQNDCRNDGKVFLESMKNKGIKPLSGLRSLGVTSGKLHEILPA